VLKVGVMEHFFFSPQKFWDTVLVRLRDVSFIAWEW